MFLSTMLQVALLATPLPNSVDPAASMSDTARVMKDQVLPDVVVRPGKMVLISTLQAKKKDTYSYALLAEMKLAVHLPATTRGQLQLLQLQFEKRPIEQGSLRLRLLEAPSDELTTVPDGPNLLGQDIELSPAQINRSKSGNLLLDLSAYNLDMPQHGIVVLIECLGPADAPHHLSVGATGNGTKGPMVVTTGENGAHVSYLNQWPKLKGATSSGPGRTWVYGHGGQGWKPRKRVDGLIYNSFVSVVVLSSEPQTRK